MPDLDALYCRGPGVVFLEGTKDDYADNPRLWGSLLHSTVRPVFIFQKIVDYGPSALTSRPRITFRIRYFQEMVQISVWGYQIAGLKVPCLDTSDHEIKEQVWVSPQYVKDNVTEHSGMD